MANPKFCSNCSRCFCCLLRYDRQRMGTPELCKRSRPVLQIMTVVFPAFTLNPFFSMASFHIKNHITHSSRELEMMTRSSVYRSSQGTPARNSYDKAYSTMVKSKGLVRIPTFTSNSWLKSSSNIIVLSQQYPHNPFLNT